MDGEEIAIGLGVLWFLTRKPAPPPPTLAQRLGAAAEQTVEQTVKQGVAYAQQVETQGAQYVNGFVGALSGAGAATGGSGSSGSSGSSGNPVADFVTGLENGLKSLGQ